MIAYVLIYDIKTYTEYSMMEIIYENPYLKILNVDDDNNRLLYLYEL